jgi:hypothetical protein
MATQTRGRNRAPQTPDSPDVPTEGQADETPEPQTDGTPEPQTENAVPNEVTVDQVREWARGEGMEVSDAGRLAAAVRDAYVRAHPDHAIIGDKKKRDYVRKVFAPVPLDLLESAFEEVPEEEWADNPLTGTGIKERDPAQLKIDEQVKTNYDSWVAKGKPAVHESPRGRFRVSPDHAPAINYMIKQAATHHKIVASIEPPKYGQDGRQIILFTTRDKPPKRQNKPTGTVNEDAQTEAKAENDAATA